jgi:hypothetical protein
MMNHLGYIEKSAKNAASQTHGKERTNTCPDLKKIVPEASLKSPHFCPNGQVHG